VEVPYPFGLTEACNLDESFNITCDDSSGIAKTGTIPVTNISIETHELHVLNFVARDCYNRSGGLEFNNSPSSRQPGSSPFLTAKISSLFLAVTLMHTSVGSKTENGSRSDAHLNAQVLTMWSMDLALALGVAR
jgi:hypothetical protein